MTHVCYLTIEWSIIDQQVVGRIIGIECKAGATIKSEALKEMAGNKFHRGIVLYTGSNILGFAEDMQAVPASALWEITS